MSHAVPYSVYLAFKLRSVKKYLILEIMSSCPVAESVVPFSVLTGSPYLDKEIFVSDLDSIRIDAFFVLVKNKFLHNL